MVTLGSGSLWDNFGIEFDFLRMVNLQIVGPLAVFLVDSFYFCAGLVV